MTILKVPVGKNDHLQGNPKAPVILVEYGDYECPYCGEAYPIVKRVQKVLGKNLGFVFRNFPLTELHPHALQAALAAEAAGLQGKFWEIHDTLFENQETLEDEDLIGFARRLGLDPGQFNSDRHSRGVQKKVKDDFLGGALSGVNGTPTFFINGRRHDGYYDFKDLLGALERAAGRGLKVYA